MSATIGMVAVGMTVFFVLVAVMARSSAPAVSVSAVAGLVGGAIAFVVWGADGPHGVPLAVAGCSSLGVVLGAVVGVAVSRRREPDTWPMWRAALGLLAATPLLVATLLLTALDACPLYNESRRAGYCHNDVDLLGDWISGVTVLFAFDLLVWFGLLWFAPGSVGGDRRSNRVATFGAIAVGLIAAGWWLFPPTPDVVGDNPKRAYTALRRAGFDSEFQAFQGPSALGLRRCDDGPRDVPPRDPVICVLGQEPRIGLLGHAARGTAITLYLGESRRRVAPRILPAAGSRG